MSETSLDDNGEPQFPPGTLAPPGNFLRRQREEDNPSRAGSRASSVVSKRRKHKKWDDGNGPGGPVSQSAIFPASRLPQSPGVASPEPESEKVAWQPARETTDSTLLGDSQRSSDPEKAAEMEQNTGARPQEKVDVYDEGDQILFENRDGDVLDIEPSHPEAGPASRPEAGPSSGIRSKSEGMSGWSIGGFRQRVTDFYSYEAEKRKDADKTSRRHEPARAYQYGNTIIVEDKDGEIVKTYDLPTNKPEGVEASGVRFGNTLKFMGIGGSRATGKSPEAAAEEGEAGSTEKPAGRYGWANFGGRSGGPSHRQEQAQKKEQPGQEEKKIRFTINGEGQRMTEADFIQEVRKLDASTRKEVLEQSNASQEVKRQARQEAPAARKQQANVNPIPIPIITKDSSGSTSETKKQGASDSSAERLSSEKPSEMEGETAAERKRRLAVLATQGDDEPDTGETPAERRRREAALGLGEDSDSDDEGDERVPAARIRFAEPDRGRTRN